MTELFVCSCVCVMACVCCFRLVIVYASYRRDHREQAEEVLLLARRRLETRRLARVPMQRLQAAHASKTLAHEFQ